MSWTGFPAPAEDALMDRLALGGGGSGRVPVSKPGNEKDSFRLAISPGDGAGAFVKRVETVVRFAGVTVVCDDGKSEADLIWLALIA